MRRIKEDIKNVGAWKPCLRRHDIFSVTYTTTGAVYYNPHDTSNSTARYRTPILVRDKTGAYWTETVRDLQNQYEQMDGAPIGDDFIELLKTGEFYDVRPKDSVTYWSILVDVKEYGWECPFGANKSNLPRGDGDYLVCRGNNKPDLRTMKVVHNSMFNLLYTTKEV